MYFFPEDQLKNFRIEVSKDRNVFNTFAAIAKALKPGETKRFSKNPGVTGSVVRIINVDKEHRVLTLCEVKVYVKETGRIYSQLSACKQNLMFCPPSVCCISFLFIVPRFTDPGFKSHLADHTLK